MDQQLLWTGDHGQLATALGVTDHRVRRIESTLAPIIARDGALKEMFDALESLDLTFNEWTSAVFALGYWNGIHDKGST